MKLSSNLCFTVPAALALAACGSNADKAETENVEVMDESAAPQMATGTVVEVAKGNPDFSTLVSAVSAAGLVETLSGTGPYTIFAPTNAAFDKVGEEALGELMQPANKADLTSVLTYHVVSGEMTGADIATAIEEGGGEAVLTTVQGEDLKATKEGDVITLTDANGETSTVVLPDVEADNGVIHAIDTVVMPAM